jgi:integrase
MFFRYCVDLGLTSANVASQVEVNHRELSHAQRETRTILPFTAAEVRRIVENETGWWRWATAISAATGLRLGDVATLEHATLATPRHIAVWTDKRDRRVLLPVNDRLTPGLAAVLAEIPPTDSPFLFPEQAAQYDDVKAGRPKFSIYFARVLDKLGIDRQAGRKSFHSLRHTAITRWEKAGFSLDECKDFAGHADAKTTQGYLHE